VEALRRKPNVPANGSRKKNRAAARQRKKAPGKSELEVKAGRATITSGRVPVECLLRKRVCSGPQEILTGFHERFGIFNSWTAAIRLEQGVQIVKSRRIRRVVVPTGFIEQFRKQKAEERFSCR
jgi:hypothetical protein